MDLNHQISAVLELPYFNARHNHLISRHLPNEFIDHLIIEGQLFMALNGRR